MGTQSSSYKWPTFDENSASSMCDTSGTTGNPKAALYSHRSTMLHALAGALPDSLSMSARDCVLPVVPLIVEPNVTLAFVVESVLVAASVTASP